MDIQHASVMDAIMAKVREWMRIMHYAKRTETSYLQWIARFLRYVREQGSENVLTTRDFSSYISHLATRRKVNASTQNQAAH